MYQNVQISKSCGQIYPVRLYGQDMAIKFINHILRNNIPTLFDLPYLHPIHRQHSLLTHLYTFRGDIYRTDNRRSSAVRPAQSSITPSVRYVVRRFPIHAITLRDLLILIVRAEVAAFDTRQHNNRLTRVLTQTAIVDGASGQDRVGSKRGGYCYHRWRCRDSYHARRLQR